MVNSINLSMDEVFVHHIILVIGLPWKEVHTMVHIIPKLIRGVHGLNEVFIIMEDGGTGGI